WERGDDDAGDDRTPVSGTGSVELPAAGGLAARLARRLREYRDGLAASVEAKERRLQTKGYGGSEG
ncbi:MAG: hypothetical protein ACM3WT_00825, partial [Bacillota bacterium]